MFKIYSSRLWKKAFKIYDNVNIRVNQLLKKKLSKQFEEQN